jgi:hypothetical protein
MNYRPTLSVPALSPRRPYLPIFLAPKEQKEECHDR